MGAENFYWNSELAHDQWVILPVSGPRPSARYKHVAAVVDEKLNIIGGSHHGRYLSDVQVVDLRNLALSTVKLNMELVISNIHSPQERFSAVSGHSMIKWENKLLILDRHSKIVSDNVSVRFIDLESHVCGVLETSGKVPVARGRQSVSLVGSRLIMFRGEDMQRRLLNDVHVLNLETVSWDFIETTSVSDFIGTLSWDSFRYPCVHPNN